MVARFRRPIKLFFHSPKRKYYVLGIESSCDDSAAAVVNDSGTILGECIHSQNQIHIELGGILPNVAHKLHLTHLQRVVDLALKQSQRNIKDIDAVAVTVKPGLILSLEAGVNFAKEFCIAHNKPLLPIHHMEAHALTARMTEKIDFPFLSLLISGGHCILALVKSASEFYTLGNSMDSSPGQLFDKIARRAKLSQIKDLRGLSGGESIEVAARGGDPTALCTVLLTQKILMRNLNCHMSFGGLLSKASSYIKSQEEKLCLEPDEVIPDYKDLCAGLQWAVAKHLCERLEIAILYAEKIDIFNKCSKVVVASGGVASNHFIRLAMKYMCDRYEYDIIFPPAKLCTDNGAMIAWNGIEKLKENPEQIIRLDEFQSVTPVPRCELGEDISSEVENELKMMKKGRHKSMNAFIAEYKAEHSNTTHGGMQRGSGRDMPPSNLSYSSISPMKSCLSLDPETTVKGI